MGYTRPTANYNDDLYTYIYIYIYIAKTNGGDQWLARCLAGDRWRDVIELKQGQANWQRRLVPILEAPMLQTNHVETFLFLLGYLYLLK